MILEHLIAFSSRVRLTSLRINNAPHAPPRGVSFCALRGGDIDALLVAAADAERSANAYHLISYQQYRGFIFARWR